jgi:hypothetical protein
MREFPVFCSEIKSACGRLLAVAGALAVLLVSLAGGPALAAGGEVIFEGRYHPGDLTWDQDDQGGYIPVLPETGSLAQPGLSRLPALDLLLLVPAELTVAEAWVEPLATHTEPSPGPLAVAGPLVSSEGQVISQPRMSAGNGAFPAAWGEFKGSHVWRGYRLLAVTVHPLRETESGLEFLDGYAVHVRYGEPVDPDQIARRERLVPGEAQANRKVLSGLVANPERIAGYLRDEGVAVEKSSTGFAPTRTPSLSGSPVDYLIITNEAMAPEFQRLADHKTARGIRTVVATREFISANFRNGADIQETVRMFIKDAYQKWGIEYVLLGGDTDVLPARYVSNSFYPATGSTDIPVDLYFAGLDGTWNANANAFYGEPALDPEPGDDADFAEEVYIGRATVSNAEMAAVFVDKTIGYEITPSQAQWPGRVIYAAEVLFPAEYEDGLNIILDGAQFSNQMVTELVEPCTAMERTRLYETDVLYPMEAPLNRAALIDSLNTGHYGIFNQIGHGYYFNMSVGDGNFMNADADNLTNGDHPFLLFSLNCASCAFDYSCLMERFLQNPNGGSVASIGSARAAFPNTSNNYQQEFFSHLFCGEENRVGRLIALSRLPYLPNTFYNYVDRWTFENYTLLGDPTLALWSGSPRALEVQASPVQLGPNTVTVSVHSASFPAEPVAGALVCLQREGEDLAVGSTDSDGLVQFDYLAQAEGEILLTVSGHNLEQTSLPVAVQDGDTYLSLLFMGVQDDGSQGTVGNDNGQVESGEQVALWPILQETAGSGTAGIEGVISCDDPRVAISQPDLTFPAVGGGGQVTVSAPAMAHFDPAIPDGTPIDFQLDLTDQGGASFLTRWTVVMKAPEIEVSVVDWEDQTYGNGDGWLDDGERVNVTVHLKNYGAGRADAISGTLRTDNANVVLHDTLATFPAIELLEEGVCSVVYSLELINAVRKSESYLLFEDSYGRVVRHDFYLQRPEAPEIIESDSSLGADVIALRWSPSPSSDVLGYDVYRSKNENGPFTRINPDVIAGVAYYRDEGLDLLTRYYYRIVTVDESMVASGPSVVVQQATAPAEASGYPVPFVNETSSHLAVGDVDGDGDLEIVLASDEVYVWHHDGTELLDGDSDSQTLGPMTDLNTSLAPAGVVLAQLDGESGLEMVISDLGNDQQIFVFRHDGSVMPGWPQVMSGLPGTCWNWATPAVGDVDGDGDSEIVVNTLNGRTWVWHHDGTELRDGDNDPATNGVFHVRSGATWEWGHSSPALYDLDGDGAKDIIFGCKTNDELGRKLLVALKYDGSDVPGFPYVASGAIDNAPALGDLDNDGVMEIVFYDWSQRVYVVRQDGTDYPGFPVNYGFGSTFQPGPCVALGDMDDDGQLEIVFAVVISGDESRILAFDTDVAGGTSGQLLDGWPRTVPGSSEGSPVLGDIDGDGSPDVVFGIGGGSEDAPDNLYAFHATGEPIDGFPITLGGPLMPSPVITDLDHDLDVDIVYGGWDREVHVWDMPFAYDRHNVPWPTYSGNMLRDGVFFPMALVGVQDEEEVIVPTVLKVGAPYPNPFNPSTSVRLYVPGDGGSAELELAVYDLQGRRIRLLHQGSIAPGWHTMVWDGRDDRGQGQASGLYFMRARSSGVDSIKKMTLVK